MTNRATARKSQRHRSAVAGAAKTDEVWIAWRDYLVGNAEARHVADVLVKHTNADRAWCVAFIERDPDGFGRYMHDVAAVE